MSPRSHAKRGRTESSTEMLPDASTPTPTPTATAVTDRVPTTPDARWFAETVSCRAACPVGTDAAAYVRAISERRFSDAYDIARAHNPFPSICGRVCSAPCERACRRGVIDAPVAIRALKRSASNHAGAERHDRSRWHVAHGPVPRATGPSIGIVGAGPAGLAAAYALRLAGCAVTLYEADATAGGMLRAGIPAFRLPRDVLRAEVDAILSLGISLVSSCEIGRDRSLEELLFLHASVLITVGCRRGRSASVPGSDLPGVMRAVDVLRAINGDATTMVRTPVVVVGGGSVAFDAARVARRSAHWDDVHTALDAARLAARRTTSSVQLIAPEAAPRLAVPREELREADVEGVRVRAGMGIRAINGTTHVESVTLAPIARLRDDDGRFRPQFAEGRDEVVPASTVIFAIGQESDTDFVAPDLDVGRTAWGGIPCDRDGRTRHARLYAAGDVATGPRDVILAVAAGQRAARTILQDLSVRSARTVAPARQSAEPAMEPSSAESVGTTPRSWQVGVPHRVWTGYDVIARRVLPVLPLAERQMHDEVERVLRDDDAVAEATRCLHCDAHVMLDAARCVACALCVDVCPYGCLALLPHGADTFALSLDETACIRCGLCIDRCPPGALSLERVVVHE